MPLISRYVCADDLYLPQEWNDQAPTIYLTSWWEQVSSLCFKSCSFNHSRLSENQEVHNSNSTCKVSKSLTYAFPIFRLPADPPFTEEILESSHSQSLTTCLNLESSLLTRWSRPVKRDHFWSFLLLYLCPSACMWISCTRSDKANIAPTSLWYQTAREK